VSFVYVSNAEDGDIGMYTLRADGALERGARVKAGKAVGPMSVSPDKRFLVAAVRSQPYTAWSYVIERASGVLKAAGSGPLADSMPYITHDRSGHFLLSASYGAHLVSVNRLDEDGCASRPIQVVRTARHAHAVAVDRSNHFVFVLHLGTDQVFQFFFDARGGRLTANTPPVLQLKAGSGPRHLVVSRDNRFVYVLNELTGTVTTLAHEEGLLDEVDTVSALSPESRLRPGAPRPQEGRDVSNDIWASDLHLTPDGRFLYCAERTSSTIGTLKVDPVNGKLSYVGSTPTEKQPRGFRIDPTGKFMVVAGEKSDTLSSYAIQPDGGLKLVGKYPTGKGSNWVEIVD
jgi:6-phosphogluconolactonase